MTEVAFYHLTKRPLDAVLPRLLEKATAKGHRIIIRSADSARLKQLDQQLWTYDEGSFLPHALDTADCKEQQPILLTSSQEVPNGADVLVLIDGTLPDDLDRFSRVLYLFEEADSSALAAARSNWTGLKQRQGLTRSYWQQDDRGGWKKAQ